MNQIHAYRCTGDVCMKPRWVYIYLISILYDMIEKLFGFDRDH